MMDMRKLLCYIPQVYFNMDSKETMAWPKDSLSKSGTCNLRNRRKNNTTMISQPIALNLEVEKESLLRKEPYLVLMSNDWDH